MIECIKYKAINKGSFLGFADIYIPKTGQEIYGCKLYQKDGRRWVSLPSNEFINEQGEKKYAPMMKYRDPEHQKLFLEACVKAIEAKCAEPVSNDNVDGEFPF